MQYIEEIKDYWNLRANGFSDAVDEELEGKTAEKWEKLFHAVIVKEHADILDDGTGAGFFPVILERLGHHVTAIDYSDCMVAQAKKRFTALGMKTEVLQMDAQNLLFPEESFDAVVSRNVIWNLDDPIRAYKEMCRVLRPGGKLIISDGNMYLYHHDTEYAKVHEKFLQECRKNSVNEGSLHGKHNKDQVDFSIIEKIAENLPMSYERRPQWDFNQLLTMGFEDIRVMVQGTPLPQGFTIIAEKRIRTSD